MHRGVRALSRGLSLMAELNAAGDSTAFQLSKRTGLNRTTCYRLLETLQDEGYVFFDQTTGVFSLTYKVRSLSEGVTMRDLSSEAALPPMFDLLSKASWPSDYAVFDQGSMIIRESTHPFSPFSIHRAMIGRRRSLLRSALGRAFLAASAPRLRREMLQIAAAAEEAEAGLAQDRRYVARLVETFQEDGYASSVGETEAAISAIALPVRDANAVVGSLNLIFFRSALSPEEAAKRYLSNLSEAVAAIEVRLSTKGR